MVEEDDDDDTASDMDDVARGVSIENKHSTALTILIRLHILCMSVCMSIHRECIKSYSELGRVLTLNDPAARRRPLIL